MKVKVTNPRGGSFDYIGQRPIRIPANAKDHVIELPDETADRWIAQMKKDNLTVTKIDSKAVQPAPEPSPPPPPKEETKEEVKPTSTAKSGDTKTSTSSKTSTAKK